MHRGTISVQVRNMINQVYPTRRKAVWSELLSMNSPMTDSVTLADYRPVGRAAHPPR